MSNRNFDNRVIIQRLQNQNYARNLYKNNTNGQRIINNPQNSDGTASRYNTYIPGAQTEYFRGLQTGETISVGGIVNIPPFPMSLSTVVPPIETIISYNIPNIANSGDIFLVNIINPVSGGEFYLTPISGGTNLEINQNTGTLTIPAVNNVSGLYTVEYKLSNTVIASTSVNIIRYIWRNIGNIGGYRWTVTSDNLQKIVSASSFSTILTTSNNTGLTLNSITTGISNFIYGLTGSNDTEKLAIARGSGYIYTSTDSGLSWIERTNSGERDWEDITSSADGTKLIAVGSNLKIFISNDSGSNWTEQSNSVQSNYSEVACSSNGDIIVACIGSKSLTNTPGYIYKSSDGGINWVPLVTAGIRNWSSIDISSDGNIIIAGSNLSNFGNSGKVYISLDSGNTWIEQTALGIANWITVSVSSDGNNFGAGKELSFGTETLYISNNQGTSWVGQNTVPNSEIAAINFSNDGTNSILVVSGISGFWLYNIN